MSLPQSSISISVSLDTWLADLLDHHSETAMMKRSVIVSKAVMMYLAFQKHQNPDFWKAYYSEYTGMSC